MAETRPSSPRDWPDVAHQRLAAYDAELRLANGRVDIDGTLARLRQLGATTYYWFIGAAATDWDDLQLFLPKAADAGIEVWAYLLPPRESPPSPFGSTFSEPYRLDFPRWAQEIARLSLRHPNLTAWAIDDFYLDHAFFTPSYVRSLQSKAKAINPRLAFVPVMYPTEVVRKNVEPYREILDGVVVAYLVDRADIERARAVLNGTDGPAPGEIRFPDDTASHAGDGFGPAPAAPQEPPRRRIPLISMVAAQRLEFQGRHGAPATAERIAQMLRVSLQAWQAGKCDGVVTYRLDLGPQNDVFPPVEKLFHEFDHPEGEKRRQKT